MKKFELTTNTRIKWGRKLIQIRAAVSFGDVKKGDLGGWVENEDSLCDDVWIFENAEVFADAILKEGGEFRGGVFWGGVFWGGEFRGGEFRGGVFWGGEFKETDQYIAFCSIGSSGGVLTAYLVDGEIKINRGCFRGSVKQFEEQLKSIHKNNQHSREYKIALELIKLRFTKIKKEKS